MFYQKYVTALESSSRQGRSKFTSIINNFKGGGRCGELLEEEILSRNKYAEYLVITASLIVASVFYEGNWAEGYRGFHS